LVEIIKVIGSPTRDQINSLNENYRNKEFKFPPIPQVDFKEFFKPCKVSSEACELVSKLLKYDPRSRLTALAALTDPYFDELRSVEFAGLPNKKPLPKGFFDFTYEEMSRATPEQKLML
jgi:glycogen synthase kinase 3 beta